MARELRKVRVGQVVGNKMAKTVVVEVRWSQRHPIYGKSVRRVSKFYAHDDTSQCKVGDLVKIEETRPISHLKRWRVIEIVQHRDVAEVKPIELDRQVLAEVVEQPKAEGPAAEAATSEAVPATEAGEEKQP
jgi:small subunit ribosomal protein S17